MIPPSASSPLCNRAERTIVHSHDASARRDEEGAWLRVWNELGEVEPTARVAEEIMAGTVLVSVIWWNKHSADGRNVNQLTPQDETDMGASGSFCDVRVFVGPA